MSETVILADCDVFVSLLYLCSFHSETRKQLSPFTNPSTKKTPNAQSTLNQFCTLWDLGEKTSSECGSGLMSQSKHSGKITDLQFAVLVFLLGVFMCYKCLSVERNTLTK